MKALERLMGMLLVLLATQILLNGVRQFVESLGPHRARPKVRSLTLGLHDFRARDMIQGRTSSHVPVMVIKTSGKSGAYTRGWGAAGSLLNE